MSDPTQGQDEDFDPTGMTIDQLQDAGHDVSTAPPKDDFDPTGMTIQQLQAAGHEVGSGPTEDSFDPTGMTVDELQAQGHKISGKPQAEGPAGTILRDVAHGIGPAAVSIAPMMAGGEAGFALGAAAAPFLGPLAPAAPFVGALIGGAVGAYGGAKVGSEVQEGVLNAAGIDDSEQRRINAEANPTADVIGNIAPAFVTFNAGSITDRVAQRLLTGAGMGAVDLVQQKAEGHDINWTEAGLSAAAGAVLDQPRRAFRGTAEAGAAAGRAVGEKIPGVEAGRDYLNKNYPPGRPDMQYDQATDFAEKRDATPIREVASQGAGMSAEQPPPSKPSDNANIGNQELQPTVRGNGQNQLKTATQTETPQLRTVNAPTEDPDIAAALGNEPPETIKSAAITTNEGGTFTGNNHADAYEAATAAGHTIPENDPAAVGQFMTSNGRLVGREEAGQIADAANQRVGKPVGESGMTQMPTGPLKAEQTAQGKVPSVGQRVFRPTETSSPEQVANYRQKIGLEPEAPPAAAKAVETSKTKEAPLANLRDMLAPGEPAPSTAAPKQVTDKVIDYLRNNGNTPAARSANARAANALEKMPAGPKRDQLAARLHAAALSQTGNVPGELKNVRVRSEGHLKNLEVKGWNNPDTGKPYRTGDKDRAALYSRVHDVTKQIFQDTNFRLSPNAKETPDETMARAKAMVDKSRELMDRNGQSPLEVYTMNHLRKPREWSLLREANALVTGRLKPDYVYKNGQAEAVNTPVEKFLANERLHRGSDEDYATFEKNNQAEAAEAKSRRPAASIDSPEAEAKVAAEQTGHTDAMMEPNEESPEERIDRMNAEAREANGLPAEDPLKPFEQDYKKWLDKNGGDNPAVVDRAMRAYINRNPEILEDKSFNAIRAEAMQEQPAQQPQAKGKESVPGWQGQRRNLPKGVMSFEEAAQKIVEHSQMRQKANEEAVATANGPKVSKITAAGPAPKAATAIAASKAKSLRGNLLSKIFSPTTVSPASKNMETIIREKSGLNARDFAQAAHLMEPFRKPINQSSEADRISFMKAVDTGAKTAPEFQELADRMKGVFQKVKGQLQALPSMSKQQFIQEFFPHMWENPKSAAEFVSNYFMKQGSGASLQARTMPTIEDGLKAGLKLASSDPIEVTMRYLSSMHNFIESQRVLQEMKDRGMAITIPKASVGASGNPSGKAIPPGYAPLHGRGAVGEQMYAPEDAANVYNNYIDQGIHKNQNWGKVYDTVQHGFNSVTALELGLSAYHMFTMGKEAIISEFARGLSNVMAGDITGGAKVMGKSVAAPYYLAHNDVAKAYLDPNFGSPDLQKMVDLMTRSGARMVGKRQDPTYKYSAMGSYFTAWRRGALQQQLRDVRTAITNAGVGKASTIEGAAAVGVQTGKEVFRAVGRAMETVTQPLFEKYIPTLKNGAYYETLSDWLKANPTATDAQQVAMAAKIGDSIDNRFGEMIHDNIFWNKALKQSLQLMMRSYSWNLGTVREIGGGALGALSNPSKLSMAHPDYDPRTAYVMAMPAVVALTSMVYQYLKTGKGPGEARDLMVPQTGGTATGAASGSPERAILPGYEKDVFGWFHDPGQEAINKIATAPRLIWETLANKDFMGHYIADPRDPLVKRMGSYLGHVAGSMGPISIKQTFGGVPKGTGISRVERATAIRQAPTWMEDPERVGNIQRREQTRQWNQKVRSDRRYQGSLQ